MKMVGKREIRTFEFAVRQNPPGGETIKDEGLNYWCPTPHPPFMPASFEEGFHPGGNSLCYMIQTAHLMGCDPIYALGFTFKSGSGYFYGLTNPVTKRRSYWLAKHPTEWLAWYQKVNPNRVRLLPEWEGPIYDLLPTEDFDAYRRRLLGGPRTVSEGAAQSNAGAFGWAAAAEE